MVKVSCHRFLTEIRVAATAPPLRHFTVGGRQVVKSKQREMTLCQSGMNQIIKIKANQNPGPMGYCTLYKASGLIYEMYL